MEGGGGGSRRGQVKQEKEVPWEARGGGRGGAQGGAQACCSHSSIPNCSTPLDNLNLTSLEAAGCGYAYLASAQPNQQTSEQRQQHAMPARKLQSASTYLHAADSSSSPLPPHHLVSAQICTGMGKQQIPQLEQYPYAVIPQQPSTQQALLHPWIAHHQQSLQQSSRVERIV